MEDNAYKTGTACPEEGLYQCQLSYERQHYNKGEIFDFCPLGKETEWKKIE